MKFKIISQAIAYLFIFLFVYASVNKLLDVEKFRAQIGQSPILTDIASFLAWFVPGLELIISCMLATNRFRLPGFYAAFCLMVMFTTYIIFILGFSEDIPCSCGGVLDSLGWNEHLVFNFSFVALAVAGIATETTRIKEQNKITFSHE